MENRIKIGISAIAATVLEAYGMSNKSNKKGRCHTQWRMEKLIVTIDVLFYTANDEQMDQRTLSALSHLSRGYDMVQVYTKDV
jgi:hypothetical protein